MSRSRRFNNCFSILKYDKMGDSGVAQDFEGVDPDSSPSAPSVGRFILGNE